MISYKIILLLDSLLYMYVLLYTCRKSNRQTFFYFQYRKSDQREDTKVERVDFILSEPEATVNGVLDNSPSDWLSLRVGHGVVSHYQVTKPSVGRGLQ